MWSPLPERKLRQPQHGWPSDRYASIEGWTWRAPTAMVAVRQMQHFLTTSFVEYTCWGRPSPGQLGNDHAIASPY